jgi:rifampicin phosphotransferase
MDRWITDTEPSQRFPVYTRANAGEVLPTPLSPLAWSLTWAPGTVMGWRDSQVNTGTLDPEEVPEDDPKCVATFGGYFYINASMSRIFGVRAPGLSADLIDFVYFGTQPDVPPYIPHPDDERPDLTERLAGFMTQALTTTDLPELRDDRDLADAIRANRPDLFELGDADLVAHARSFQPELRRLFETHLTVTAGGSVGSGIIQMATMITGDPTKSMRLLAGLGDIDSAAPSMAMWELSRIVRLSPVLTELFDGGVSESSELDDRLRADDSVDARAFSAAIDDFLFEFGSRGPNEWEIQAHTWETRPTLVYAAIDRMRFAEDGDSPALRHAERVVDREAVSAEMHALLGADEAGLAQFTMGEASAKAYLTGRERAKTNIIKVLHEVRMAIHEIGMRAVEAGVVDDPFDVTMLLDDELDEFIVAPEKYAEVIRSRLAG